MITDRIPKSSNKRSEYERSDALLTIAKLPVEPFRSLSAELEVALKQESQRDVRRIANQISKEFARAAGIEAATVSVLGARPLEVSESQEFELFGDYQPDTQKIRLWMRTAVHKRTTAFGTFLSTLCHELCHHWDMVGLDLPNTYHTRGFYIRAGLLYHHMRGTPVRPLVFDELKGGLFAINWPRTMKGAR
ncbi:MAG: hypothetical protein AB7W16_21250 [Candidatus Obscuribacterales bacterium]